MSPVTSRRVICRRPGSRAAEDSGVNQSAAVALLLVLIIAITSVIGPLGPQLGGVVIADWLCNLLNPGGTSQNVQGRAGTGQTYQDADQSAQQAWGGGVGVLAGPQLFQAYLGVLG